MSYQYSLQSVYDIEPKRNGSFKEVEQKDIKILHTNFPLTNTFIKDIRAIDGMAKVKRDSKYSLFLKKGTLFEWQSIAQEIDDQIEELEKMDFIEANIEIFDRVLKYDSEFAVFVVFRNMNYIKQECDDKFDYFRNQIVLRHFAKEVGGIMLHRNKEDDAVEEEIENFLKQREELLES